MRILGAIGLVVLAQALAACGPTGPSRVPAPDSNTGQLQGPQPQPGPGPAPFYLGFVLDTSGRPLADARVEVVDGPRAGQSMISDAEGHFQLTGTFDDGTAFRASKEGYLAATVKLKVESGPSFRWLGFYLEVLASPVNIAGDYSLAVIADSACTDLPDQVRTRTYPATIALQVGPDVPANTRFTLTVTGAAPFRDVSSVLIGIAGGYLALWIDDSHGTPFLTERIEQNMYLFFGGTTAEAQVEAPVSTIAISLNGVIDYCEMKSNTGTFYSCLAGGETAHLRCASTNHRLVLTRR